MRLVLLVGCGQLCFLSNQIAWFFNHHYRGKEAIYILIIFAIGIVANGWQPLKLPLLSECSQVCFSSNQIAGLCDHWYLWKESMYILDLLHGHNHQVKVTSETTSFGWMYPSLPLWIRLQVSLINNVSENNQLIR